MKIVLIGAGSAIFGVDTLIGLFEEREALRGSSIMLVDIDEARLDAMLRYAVKADAELEAGYEFDATTERQQALVGADAVIVSVEVGRIPAWRKDYEIPLRYGIQHPKGENAGPGGLSHALRSVPIVLDICRDIERLAPGALVLNYTNPMSRVCLAATRYTDLQVVGLCHQIGHAYFSVGKIMGWVTGERSTLAGREEVRRVFDRLDLRACGINHMTWITQMFDRDAGVDIYDEFRARLAISPPDFEPVCRRLHDVFGLYPTSGDAHIGEHLAWSRLSPSRPDFHGLEERSRRRAAQLDAANRGEVAASSLLTREGKLPLDRAPAIIAGVAAGREQVELAVNVPNHGCLDGLPSWAIVEVPGVAGAAGVSGVAMGALPPGITALLNEQVAIQDRAVEAAIHGDPKAARQALLIDPVTNQDVETADALLADLLSAHETYLPQFA